MKKTVILLVLLLVIALVFAGCKKEEAGPTEPVFALDSREDIITVTAEGALQGTGGVGHLSFSEGDDLSYQLNGENGEEQLHVYIFYKDEPEDPLSYTQTDSDKVYLDFTIDNGTGGRIGMEPGEYAFLVEVGGAEFTGTATFEVTPDEFSTGIANPWTTADNVDMVNILCGFPFNTPETVGEMHRDTEYSVAQEMKIASVSYLWTDADGGEWIKGEIRKAVKHLYDPDQNGPLSGIWDTYDEEKTADGIQLFIKEGLVRVAEWETDNFRYSIWCQDGLSEEDMLAVVGQVD